MEEIYFDPKRRLCPDGACVGILGADGRCSVCRRLGSVAAGAQEAQTVEDGLEASSETIGDEAAGADATGDDLAASSASTSSAPASSGFDPNRRLCDDGSCVGVIGPDGACGTCGRRPE
jgi:hypothetical protein